jgi:hypothetical protein
MIAGLQCVKKFSADLNYLGGGVRVFWNGRKSKRCLLNNDLHIFVFETTFHNYPMTHL